MTTANSESPRAPKRARRTGRAGTTMILLFYALAGVGSLFMALAGRGVFGRADGDLFLLGIIGLLLVLTTAPLAAILDTMRRTTTDDRVASKIEDLTSAVRHLTEQAALSDDARRVLNREAERDLLCRTIEQDIQEQAWDAGLVLCGELADRFGYRAEAEQYRQRIEHARSEVLGRRVADAIAHLDGLIIQRRWDAAVGESSRIRRLFPDSPRVENLRQRVEQAKAVYKHDLERRFLDAAEQDRVDDALELLKELDGYLTVSEAEPYREVARGVIGKAKENLGAQFKIAVQDRQWGTAAAIGRRIIKEFPNTRMAQEVRQMLDGILTKANAAASV